MQDTAPQQNIAGPAQQVVPFKEKISYALTNTGQCMIYAIFTSYLLLYMTDYMGILPAVAGVILMVARIFDALNDPVMGQIVDRTKSRWGKCRPYMLFTPVPIFIFTLLMFIPVEFSSAGAIAYATVIYLIFTMIYTANDIPYWSMSAVITTDPKQRTAIVTLTRLIGGLGSGILIGGFWMVNKFMANAGANKNMSFFLSVLIFGVFGTCLMLQGFFNTKERAVNTKKPEPFFQNLKLIPKCKPLMLNILAGMFMAVMMVGSTAMTTYFIKWNMKEIFPGMDSNSIMSIFTPVIGILPAIASVAGLISVPALVKRFEKRTLLIIVSIWGAVVNFASFFAGYMNIYLFIALRFLANLPAGIWSGITTLMIGDSVDYIEYYTGKRVEGTCFSLLTFMGKFQNGVNVAITGFILTLGGYNQKLDPDVAQQSPKALQSIFIMVTLVSALGYALAMIPFFFYDYSRGKHQAMLEELKIRRNAAAEAAEAAEAMAEESASGSEI